MIIWDCVAVYWLWISLKSRVWSENGCVDAATMLTEKRWITSLYLLTASTFPSTINSGLSTTSSRRSTVTSYLLTAIVPVYWLLIPVCWLQVRVLVQLPCWQRRDGSLVVCSACFTHRFCQPRVWETLRVQKVSVASRAAEHAQRVEGVSCWMQQPVSVSRSDVHIFVSRMNVTRRRVQKIGLM